MSTDFWIGVAVGFTPLALGIIAFFWAYGWLIFAPADFDQPTKIPKGRKR